MALLSSVVTGATPKVSDPSTCRSAAPTPPEPNPFHEPGRSRQRRRPRRRGAAGPASAVTGGGASIFASGKIQRMDRLNIIEHLTACRDNKNSVHG